MVDERCTNGEANGYPYLQCEIEGLRAEFGYEQKRVDDFGWAVMTPDSEAARLFPAPGAVRSPSGYRGPRLEFDHPGATNDHEVIRVVKRWLRATNGADYRVGLEPER